MQEQAEQRENQQRDDHRQAGNEKGRRDRADERGDSAGGRTSKDSAAKGQHSEVEKEDEQGKEKDGGTELTARQKAFRTAQAAKERNQTRSREGASR